MRNLSRSARGSSSEAASSTPAAATIQTSRCFDGCIHQEAFPVGREAGRERVKGYNDRTSWSKESKRSSGFFARQRATTRSTSRGTAGLRFEGGTGST